MSDLEVYDAARFENMERVASLHLKGENYTAIAKQTGLKRKEVLALIQEWKDTALADQAARDRAADALNSMDEHYNILIKKLWEVVDEVESMLNANASHQLIAQKTSALKSIAELEAKRVDTLQKAGLLDAADMGDEMAQMEEKQAVLIGILREVSGECPKCRTEVARRLGQVTGRAEEMRVTVVNE